MRTLALFLAFLLSALIWHTGYLSAKSEAAEAAQVRLKLENTELKTALREAAFSHLWNHEAVKDIYRSDLAAESKERRIKMAAILHIHKMNVDLVQLGVDTPYGESLLSDIRTEYFTLAKAEGLLEEGEYMPVPAERTLILPD